MVQVLAKIRSPPAHKRRVKTKPKLNNELLKFSVTFGYTLAQFHIYSLLTLSHFEIILSKNHI